MIEISSYWHFSTKIVLSKIKNSDLKNIWGEWQMCADFINLLTDVSVFLKNSGCNWLPSNWQLLEFSCTVLQCTRGEHKAKPWRMVIPQLPVSQSHWMCWGWEPSPMYIYKAKWSLINNTLLYATKANQVTQQFEKQISRGNVVKHVLDLHLFTSVILPNVISKQWHVNK